MLLLRKCWKGFSELKKNRTKPMKIAIIYAGQPSFNKGLASYVYEKCRRMQELQGENLQVDCYMLRDNHSVLMKLLMRGKLEHYSDRNAHEAECNVKGVAFKCLWRTYGVWDIILYSKFGLRVKENIFFKDIAEKLKNYDVICTHKTPCHMIGRYMKRHYGIPYIATWHGSDINVYPYEKKVVMEDTVAAIENANMNLFVSKGLLEASYKLTKKGKRDVIYTGAAKHFRRFSEDERLELRKQYNVEGCKVIGFVGNLVPVKNVMVLPEIFARVAGLYNQQKLVFWIIGNGELEDSLKRVFETKGLVVRFLGRKDSTEMPDFYNSMDVLIFPSKAEGFGLVALEARVCGCNVVGSDVGGIPEAIEQLENCFALGENFVEIISNRIVEILNSEESPKLLSKVMSWDYAIKKEMALCRELAKAKNQ